MLTAVIQVHPFAVRRFLSSARLDISVNTPVCMYAIIIIGTTISLAGKPSTNAVSITPVSYTHLDVYKRQVFVMCPGYHCIFITHLKFCLLS